ncbi:methyl-accepting chemotaxis protein [Photobacterium kasasachensis]|uniref:methyl-accepting chemotaxis protein n=1 Tax=Photobacterium kasasachensis TaxID=2910240 RepID=UPI003D1015C4
MKFSIARKLRISFLLITALFLCAAVILYQQIKQVEDNAHYLLNEDLPTVDASRSLQQSAQSSLLVLQAYMLQGGDEASGQALRQQLTDTFALVERQLAELKSHLTDEQYDKVGQSWQALMESEQAIVDISHTPDNLPAHALMLNEVAPIAEVALDQLQGLINEEENNAFGGERKRLMKLYADSYTSLSNALGALRDYLFDGNQDHLDKYKELMTKHSKSVAEVNNHLVLLSDSDLSLWQIFEEMQKMYLPLAEQVIILRQSPEWNKANYLMAQQTGPAAAQFTELLDAVVVAQQNNAQQGGIAISDSVSRVITTLIAVAIIACVCSLLVATWLGRSIGSRLTLVGQRAEEISHGNFSGEALENKGDDEIASLVGAVNRMTASLSALVTGVTDKAKDVDSSMNRLLENNSSTANEATNQAEKIRSMATAIEEMSVTASETAQHTQAASDDLKHSSQLLGNGEKALEQNQQTVGELNALIGRASEMVQHLSNESDRIERVTEVIESVAEQTNLLALNAAIEAARAGEQGRGFAVVADEVRLLAQRTTESTTEINAIVDAIQTSTGQVVKVISESQSLVKAGTEHTAQANTMLQDTIRYMDDVADKVSDMTTATEQQSDVSQSLADLVHQLSDSAADVSSNCDSANQTSQAIKAQVDDLNQEMRKFSV